MNHFVFENNLLVQFKDFSKFYLVLLDFGFKTLKECQVQHVKQNIEVKAKTEGLVNSHHTKWT